MTEQPYEDDDSYADGDSLEVVDTLDTDSDEMVDTVLVDLDEDAEPEAVLVDTDADQVIDTAYVDTNEDQVIDTVVMDTDGDQVADTVVMDTDYDNVPDTVLVDTDADAQLDTVLVDTDQDGTIDAAFWTEPDEEGTADEGEPDAQAAGELASDQPAQAGEQEDLNERNASLTTPPEDITTGDVEEASEDLAAATAVNAGMRSTYNAMYS